MCQVDKECSTSNSSVVCKCLWGLDSTITSTLHTSKRLWIPFSSPTTMLTIWHPPSSLASTPKTTCLQVSTPIIIYRSKCHNSINSTCPSTPTALLTCSLKIVDSIRTSSKGSLKCRISTVKDLSSMAALSTWIIWVPSSNKILTLALATLLLGDHQLEPAAEDLSKTNKPIISGVFFKATGELAALLVFLNYPPPLNYKINILNS